MLSLKDVSKFYYNKGVIASGFTKVNIDFKLGEFVIITGESGSGKSTLLNVISGMDSYEEGEMYIDGYETSHYIESEFENYRKKYIGNIFQNFNLINSYTVYQNVELILIINGNKKKNVKEKIYKILEEVDLYKYRNTKVSKLSGGQKQRVAIARALAKESQIIIADEPTGNLDSASAAKVLEILSKISKDKLVIIVTHNYEQVKQYATRKVKMHDGRIVEDKVLKDTNIDISPINSIYKNITIPNKFRLGFRNTFNIVPKLLLLLTVYLFVVSGFLLEYSAFKKVEYEESKYGYNFYFKDTNDKRIIIQKNDGSYFIKEDYDKISEIYNVNNIVQNDLLIDNSISLDNKNDFYFYGNLKTSEIFTGTLDAGKMPEKDNEIIIEGSKNDYYLSKKTDEILSLDLFLLEDNLALSDQNIFKIVGIKYNENLENYTQYSFYGSDHLLNQVGRNAEVSLANITVKLGNKIYQTNSWFSNMSVTPNNNIPVGKALVDSVQDYNCANFSCRNKVIEIDNTTIYYNNKIDLIVFKTYNKNNFKTLTGLKNYEDNQGRVFVNPEDYSKLFDDNYYQSSVYVKDIKKIDEVNASLKELNFKTFMIKDGLVNPDYEFGQIIRIVKVVVTGILMVVMFFISYFIIKLILKSRNIYFTTIRILGASKKVCKRILDIELLTIANVSYIIFVGFLVLVHYEYIPINYLRDLIAYISVSEYILIYIIMMLMTQLISNKFSKALFKKSAMKTFSEVI